MSFIAGELVLLRGEVLNKSETIIIHEVDLNTGKTLIQRGDGKLQIRDFSDMEIHSLMRVAAQQGNIKTFGRR